MNVVLSWYAALALWESLHTSMTLRAIMAGVYSQQGHPCRTGQSVEVRQSADRKLSSWQQGKDYCSDSASLVLWWCPCTADECLERSLISLCLSQYSSGLLGYRGAVSDHPCRNATRSAGLIGEAFVLGKNLLPIFTRPGAWGKRNLKWLHNQI